MINANPADMPLFTREVIKAIDALEQLTKDYDGPLFKRCNKSLGLKGSRSSLVWIVSRQELIVERHEKERKPAGIKPIEDCEETVVIANCERGDLFLPIHLNVRSVEPICSIDQFRDHWTRVLFGVDTRGYLVADAAARGIVPLDILTPDDRDAEVLANAFGSAYSWMSSNSESEFVSWSPAYRRRLTEVILAALDQIEAKYDTFEKRWVYFQTLYSKLVINFAKNDASDPGLKQIQIRMAQLACRA